MATANTVTKAPGRRRQKRPNYWLRRFLVLFILLVPFAAWRGWAFFRHDLPIKPEAPAERVVVSKPVYVVVLGVDERRDDIGRSDTMILVRLAPGAQAAELINIPRDTEVSLPGGTTTKINAAYAMGGAERVTLVVSSLLQIPKPHYVKVSFKAFEEIVDKLDGVDLHVDRHYVYSDPYQNLEINLRPGLQHLDGETALKFVRIRYDGVTNDDIGRIKRQQQFLEALRQKFVNPAYLVKVPELYSTLRQHLKTNIPEADQMMLAETLFKARGNLHMRTLPGNPDDTTGNWIFDPVEWSEVIRTWPES